MTGEAPGREGASSTDPPLRGVKVMSFADLYPGASACSVLHDLGAEVVQIERTEGSFARSVPGFHAGMHRGSQSVQLNLKDPRCVQACLSASRDYDIVIEGFRPGVMSRLGLGPAAFAAVNPMLTYVSVTGFGQVGEMVDRPGHDLTYQAVAGTLSAELAHGSPEPIPTSSLADQVSGLFAVVAALSGLVATAGGATGGHVDVPIVDSLVSLRAAELSSGLNAAGQGHVGRDPGYGVYRTRDGRRLALGVAYEDPFWDELAQIAGIPFEGVRHAERVKAFPEIAAAVAESVGALSLEVWLDRLAASDVPHAAVNEGAGVLNDPHLLGRGLLHEVGDGSGDRYVRQPLVIDGSAFGPRSTSTPAGSATRGFLADAGLAGDEIDALVADGAAVDGENDPGVQAEPGTDRRSARAW